MDSDIATEIERRIAEDLMNQFTLLESHKGFLSWGVKPSDLLA
jgi:hypothetical protein